MYVFTNNLPYLKNQIFFLINILPYSKYQISVFTSLQYSLLTFNLDFFNPSSLVELNIKSLFYIKY